MLYTNPEIVRECIYLCVDLTQLISFFFHNKEFIDLSKQVNPENRRSRSIGRGRRLAKNGI